MFTKIMRALKTQPAIPLIADEKERNQKYKYWRIRIMYSMMTGYAVFYLCRKSLAVAMPAMFADMGFTKTDLGGVLTIFSIVYGVSKFANGVLADRANPRYFMALGLLLSAVVNIFFGLSHSLIFFGLFWLLNGWFQGMGWPPCARALTHWYSPTELGTKWAIWNSSHGLGTAATMIIGGLLVQYFGWRWVFIAPSGIALLISLFLINRLRDTPQSMGLPPVEVYRGDLQETEKNEDTAGSFKEILFKYVLNNKLIWILCFANICVYVVRIGIQDWAPTFLVEAKNSTFAAAGLKTAGFEVAGILGALLAGYLSDKVFKGRRGPVCLVCMFLVAVILFGIRIVPAGHPYVDAVLLFAVGFVIYGPQFLVAVAAADFATKKAAATATGITGTFGYVGSALSGIGTGYIVDHYGWNGGFAFFIGAAIIGTFLFVFTLKHRSKALESHHRIKKQNKK